MATSDHVEVFYVDRNTGWGAALYNIKGHQISNAIFAYHKSQVMKWAAKEWPGETIKEYTKDGNPRQ